jgi:predicted nucleic acid-binding protein
MLIVDSSILIDLLGRKVTPYTTWVMQRRYVERLGITTLIACEVLQGLRTEREWTATREALLQFEIFESAGFDLALASSMNYRILRAKGITIRSTIDCLIATFCIEQRYALLHNNRDFDAFEQHLGLQVIHPPAGTLYPLEPHRTAE